MARFFYKGGSAVFWQASFTPSHCVLGAPNFRFPDVAITGALYFIVSTSMLGVMKAVLMWAPYRLDKNFSRGPSRELRLPVLPLASLLSSTGRLLFDARRPNDLIAWMVILVLGGLPTAILVGSNVKPWDLFTFGSIAGRARAQCLGNFGNAAIAVYESSRVSVLDSVLSLLSLVMRLVVLRPQFVVPPPCYLPFVQRLCDVQISSSS